MSKCILCWNRSATTREHIFLKSLYKEILPQDHFNLLLIDESSKKVMGPSSKLIKAPRYDLCENCNSSISQPFDHAFHKMTINLINVSQKLTKEHGNNAPNINLNIDPKNKDIDRYLAKHLACYINRSGYAVPRVLGEIFLSARNIDCLNVQVQIVPYNPKLQYMENKSLEIDMPHFTPGTDVLKEYCNIGMIAHKYRYEIFYGTVKFKVELKVPIEETESSFYDANNAYLALKILPQDGPFWLK